MLSPQVEPCRNRFHAKPRKNAKGFKAKGFLGALCEFAVFA